MNLTVQRISALPAPDDQQMKQWLAAAMAPVGSRELLVRIVDAAESQALNLQYRDKDKPTNVLSFPAQELPVDIPELVASQALGDLVICAEVVQCEAAEQGKNVEAHWAHLLIHGCLHLQGHDHQNDSEAEQMENLERRLLAQLNFSDPYE
ncbi:MAG: rRNA maturation RNase YbeY [Oceanococcus sp.]